MVPASQMKRFAAPPGFVLISNHFERFGLLVGKTSSMEVSLWALGDCNSNSHYFTSSCGILMDIYSKMKYISIR